MKKLIMICVMILGVAGTANAAITFDEFPLGTIVSNQYAGLGVEFLAGPLTGRLPQLSMNGAMPDQPVLRPTGEPDYYTFQGDFWMKFTTPVVDVTFDSGYWDGVGTAVIHVYDPGMGFLVALSNTSTGVDTISISGLGQIGYVYFNSIGDGAGGDIDNLDFSQIPAPGAILLGSIGAGLVGWLRRRRTL
ncbi:MAG: hypothetical protein ABIF19_15345 [Planctomycetota bacterium]